MQYPSDLRSAGLLLDMSVYPWVASDGSTCYTDLEESLLRPKKPALGVTHVIAGDRVIRVEPSAQQGGYRSRIEPADVEKLRYERLVLGHPIKQLAASYALSADMVSKICSFRRMSHV